jgi:LuxR family maltose regulon positive regulatory protein
VGTTLLKTKLDRPIPRQGIVPRPRLLRILDEGLGRKLTLLSAPAGYGKTTLLGTWASTCGCRVAWLSLDEGDNDPIRFLTYLAAAARTIEPDFGEQILCLLQTPQPPTIEELLPLLINQFGNIAGPFVLVLDDYYSITAAEVHRALAFILDHQPQAMHLVIATRVDPPLPTAQLRARGELTEFRQRDLRFTEEEAGSYMRQGLGVDVAPADIAILTDRTEGWIAGLQLAVLALRYSANIPRSIADFGESHEYIVDYFSSEILGRQPESVRVFLLKTSILEQLCGSLCDALTDKSEGNQTLERLREANLFVIPLDNERSWYRYHHLFGGMLRNKLQQEMPEVIPELHYRASLWYEEHELPDQAFEHAIAADDQATVARLVDAHLDSKWAMGEVRTVRRWIEALSGEQLQLRPELRVTRALLLADDGDIKEARRIIESVEQALEETDGRRSGDRGPSQARTKGEEHNRIEAQLCAAHAWVASLQQDPQTALEYSARALGIVHGIDHPPDVRWLSLLYIALSNVHLQLDHQQEAIDYLSRTIELGKISGNCYLVSTAMSKQAGALWAQGHIHEAAQICREGLRYIEGHGLGQLPVIDSLLITWGFIQWEQGDSVRAAECIQRGLDMSRWANHVYVQAWAFLHLTRLLISKGELDEAGEYLERATSMAQVHDFPARFQADLASLKIMALVSRGKLEEAERELRSFGIGIGGEIHATSIFLNLCHARLLLLRGNFSDAGIVLDRLLPACESPHRVADLIHAYKMRCLLFASLDDMHSALASLEKALELAEPEGYVQTFLDEGRPMARLLKEYVRRKGKSPLAGKLLAAFRQEATGARGVGAGGDLIEPLSEREREVLGLLADGL